MNDDTFLDRQVERALAKLRAGDLDAAAALLDRATASSSGHPDFLHLRAMIVLRRRRFDLAEEFAARAIAMRPASATFRVTRAQALAALRRFDEALAELHKALRMDPDCREAYEGIWEIMITCGRVDELISLVKRRLMALDVQRPPQAPQSRVPIPDTTLCCIDCNNHDLAIRALKLSVAGCEFPCALFLTDREFDLEPIKTVVIDPIRSLQEYSTFIMKQLLRYVDTDYVLLIQWDGYVVHPEVWSDQFLLFDYVGACWPHDMLGIPAECSVGNGGFSLRSRVLLEALQDPRIEARHPEDRAICVVYRQYLEQRHGIAFAPAEVANQFSFELIEPSRPTFGFHGQINIARFVEDRALRLLEAQ